MNETTFDSTLTHMTCTVIYVTISYEWSVNQYFEKTNEHLSDSALTHMANTVQLINKLCTNENLMSGTYDK